MEAKRSSKSGGKGGIFVILAVLAVVCLCAEVGNCRTITVRADGTGEYPTIQAAINAATGGDEIVCADGTYTGEGNRDIDFLGKSITVRSGKGPESCIIDCQGTEDDPHRAFYFHTNEDVNSVLDGFTISNGYADQGGGVYLRSSNPTIRNCIISKNLAVKEGGAIQCYNSNFVIFNCIIEGNKVKSLRGKGGGICCVSGKPRVDNCVFLSNSALDSDASYGGGMFNSWNCKPTLTNCLFSKNYAKAGGGMYNWEQSIPVLKNCTFVDNSTHGYGGGGIANQFSTPEITNCVFWGNRGRWGLDGNELTQISYINPSDVTINYSCIQGWTGILGGIGNIGADPGFAFDNDYHLMPDSLCVDSGDPNCTSGFDETDLDGNFRSLDGDRDGNSVADMGAYEYNADSPSIAVSSHFVVMKAEAEPVVQTLFIRNCGGEVLHWEIVGECDWLEVTPTTGVSGGEPNLVTLTLDRNGLQVGSGSCILRVVDSNAINTPINVRIYVPRILKVPQEYETIQGAIDAAIDFDEVVISDGVYTGEGNRDVDLRGKAINVKSENGPESCIIDCNGTADSPHRAFKFHNGETTNCVVEGFTLTNAYAEWGGAIYCDGASPTIYNCVIKDNRTVFYGAGIGCFESNAIISKCIISGNYSGGIISGYGDGGGTYCTRGNVLITDCIMAGNIAEERGGGVYLGGLHHNLKVVNCVITGNIARDAGGGILCSSHRYGISTPKLVNCTFAGNWAPNGSGLACDSYRHECPSDVDVVNCLLWDVGTEVWNNDGSVIKMTFSDVRGGWAGDGNIDVDPCFVEAGSWDANGVWIEGDCHLLEGSPCVNAGDPNYVGGPNETDLDGKPRVIGGRVDMGAYEFNHLPVSCIVGGDRVVEAGVECEARVVLDGSCSSDADSTAGTNDDINDFDWYEIVDACEPNSDIYLGSGEVIECNLGLGEHLIILEVTDKAGAFDTNEVVITVEDVTPPELSLFVEPSVLWPPNHRMVRIDVSWEVSDDCDEEVEVSLVGVTSSEEEDGRGDGRTKNDIIIADDGSIYLRAERTGSGAGRVYTITYEAVDDSGNATVGSAEVLVPDGYRWRHRENIRHKTLDSRPKTIDSRLQRKSKNTK